jgi:tetratricopeptide (TPR) repeat protein
MFVDDLSSRCHPHDPYKLHHAAYGLEVGYVADFFYHDEFFFQLPDFMSNRVSFRGRVGVSVGYFVCFLTFQAAEFHQQIHTFAQIVQSLNMRNILMLLLATACLAACKDPLEKRIATMETELQTNPNKEKAAELIAAYRELVKAKPENNQKNVEYLTRASVLQRKYYDDPVSGVKWTMDAVIKYADKNTDLEPSIRFLASVWAEYTYKTGPTARLGIDDIDGMKKVLLQNTAWMDSSLARLSRQMGSPIVTDKEKAEEYLDVSEGYAHLAEASNPDKYAEVLTRAAGLAKTMENPNRALQFYYKLYSKKPDHAKAPTALFMMAFIYEDDLHDMAKAKSTYEEFLKKYPNDADFADDAKMALQLLGKSPEELVKGFESK